MYDRFRRTFGDRIRASDWVRRLGASIRAHPRAALFSVAGLCAAASLALTFVLLSTPPTGRAPDPAAEPSLEPAVPEASPSPTGDWSALTLAPYEPTADLIADVSEGSRVSPTTTFTLQSAVSTPAVEMAARLVIEPSTEVIVEAGTTAELATVQPVSPLLENALYRFRLHDTDGALVDEWVFRTSGPLSVVRRVPEDHSTQVPLSTGIEFEFDQGGVADIAEHFSIDPAAAGTFEQHGRTWVFVPSEQLAPATLYTVTLGAGVHVEGTDQGLDDDVRFAFETAAEASSSSNPPTVGFEFSLFEIRPFVAGVVPVALRGDIEGIESLTRRATLFRLATAPDALDAAMQLATDRSWATRSSNGAFDTSGLVQEASFDVVIHTPWVEQRMELPTGLNAGFYLLELTQEGRPAQLVLQVTDLAAFVLTSDAHAIAWVNDLATDRAVGGATLAAADGTILGQTDASGLLQTAITAVADSAPVDVFGSREPQLMLVTAPDGAEVIAAVTGGPYSFAHAAPAHRWWVLLGTDRLDYRTNDTIRVWGFIRSRADRSIPETVELQLFAGWDRDAPIARTSIQPTSRGTLLGELPVHGLPPGQYDVALVVGQDQIGRASVTVTEIRKPSLRLELDTERRSFIQGESIAATVRASFFDGTSAPGLELNVGASGVSSEAEHVVRLGPNGTAEITFETAASGIMVDHGNIHVSPASPEEGTSSATTSFLVFPSNLWIEADATMDEGVLTLTGRLSHVDLAAADAQFALEGWATDPSGDPAGGQSVTATVDRVTWTAVQSGTVYDFLEKQTVPVYRYERSVETVGSFRPVTGADGRFDLALPFDAEDAAAEIRLTATDTEGRAIELSAWASPIFRSPGSASDFPYLEHRAFCGSPFITAELGEAFQVTVRSGEGTPNAAGRTLFAVSRPGEDDAVITTEAGIESLFDDADLPSLSVRAVRVSSAGYVDMGEVGVRVNPEDKTIAMSVEPDRRRYAPGDEIRLAVTTNAPDGRPIAADVIIQAVDARLHAIGAAEVPDPSRLMQASGSGFAGSYATHRVTPPALDSGCGASTGGEDPRRDFQDNAAFQLIRTESDGRGTAVFEAPDDLTSWVVAATAFSDDLDVGTTSVEVPVGLPFFVTAAVAPDYLAGEQPILHVRAYGDDLRAGDAVTFAVEGPSLGMEPISVEGRAFETTRVPLPAVPLGDHELTITAEGPGDVQDGVYRTVRVVPTRLRTLQRDHAVVSEEFAPTGGDGMTTYVISDAGRGALVPVLQQLAWSGSARLDASMAAELARQILVDEFAIPETSLPSSSYAGIGPQHPEGLPLMPYASGDLLLTARTALVAPELAPPDYLIDVFRRALEGEPIRERAIVALAGLAGVGQDVLSELHAIDPEGLSIREQTWLALGLVAAGDEDAARAIERAILTEHGQRLDAWVRLDTGTATPEGAETTASMLLLAATLRDPVATDIARYLLENPLSEYLPALEQIGFARSALEWLPRVPARFTWSVADEQHEQTLEPGESLTLTLTAAQRESFQLSPVDGELSVASSWLGPARYEDLSADPSVRIERTVSPPGHAPADDLVRVTLDVHFTDPLEHTCYQVTDLLPSGLAPVVERGWQSEDGSVIPPYEVEGQRVSWCIGTEHANVTLGYAARVVSSGSYRWEPAVIQAVAAPTIGAATPPITYDID